MSSNYVVTPQRATAVSGAVKCHFTGEDQLNLVVVKNTRLEIYTVTPEGLKLIKEVGIYGRIALIKAFKPHGEAKDVLFILTAKYNAAILEWRKDGEIITRAYGNVAENTGRPSEMGMIAIIDPECKLIGLRLVDGLFKVLQWQSDSRELKLTSLRMEQINVLDITFLHGCSKPTIAFIYQSSNNGRHIQTYEVSLQDKELIRGPWKQDNIETEAAFIIPVPKPMGGVIVLGEESITYHFKENGYVAIAPPVIKLSTIAVWEQIDPEGLRYLLGDMAGRLFMLVLERGATADGVMSVKDMKIELLGETSIPECVVYLDNGVVFIGSRLGDSQLIRLSSEPDERGSFVTILDSYTNLGPIVDMIVVDLERQGQNQLITCSNAFKDGSIRIIRNGVGIQENASIDLPGIKGLWALCYDTTSARHNCLTIAFVGQTRTLLLNDEEVEESELPGFEYNEQTFHAGNLDSASLIVQVVESAVRLIDANGHGLIDCWKLPVTESRINVVAASATNRQVLLSSGRNLYYLTIEDKRIVERSRSTLEFEVACLDMSLLNAEGLAEVAAVGLWTDISVRIIHLPSMNDISREQLGGEIIPRSILICQFEGLLYLLVALGDGTLLYYRMHQTSGALIDKKKMTLGTQPITLKVFQSRGAVNVFGCSDRPTIIYSSNQKLVFSNVNMRLITQICPLNTTIYRECLAMTDGQTLIIGSVDEIQKLHIRTVPLGETVRRIAHQESTKTFGLLTVRYEMVDHNGGRLPLRQSASTLAQTTSHSGTTIRQGSSGGPSTASTSAAAAAASAHAQPLAEGDQVEVHNILILDQTTFEIIHAHQLGPNEHACSITSCKLGDDPVYYYIVGTAFVYNEEPDSKHGRLLVFEYSINDQSGPQFLLIHEKEIKGAPYSLTEFNHKLLAAINSSVRLFEWSSSPGEKELRLECSQFTFIIALYLKTKGDFVLVGDLMRSVTLLLYKPLESSFEEIAKDYQPNWMTAVEIIDDDTFLGAENSFNLFTCQKDSAATTEEDRQHLQEIGRFHTGEMVNCFRHGSLVMQQHVSDSAEVPVSCPILFGTVSGAIGLVAQIPEHFFKFLRDLENRLSKNIRSVGKIEHSSWRSFQTDRRVESVVGFVDGDLIEAFLDLSRDQMSDVIAGMQLTDDETSGMKRDATVDDVIKIVEELSRMN